MLQEVMTLDKYTVPTLELVETSPGQIAREYVSMNRPLMITGYANSWNAVKLWFNPADPDLVYLKKQVGNSSIQAS